MKKPWSEHVVDTLKPGGVLFVLAYGYIWVGIFGPSLFGEL